MPFSWDDYPYTNFHELNLDWFIKKFKEIFDEWDALYANMNEWKTNTDTELTEWKSETENDLTDWKEQTEDSLDLWETGVIDSLNDWKDAFYREFQEDYQTLADRVTAIVSDTEDMVENLAVPFVGRTWLGPAK
mgnify:CR=1 FL=1